MNETINNLDITTIKVTSLNLLEYVRTSFLNLSGLLAKYFPFEATQIQIILMALLSLWISTKLVDPRQKSNIWILLAGTIFYFLYFFK